MATDYTIPALILLGVLFALFVQPWRERRRTLNLPEIGYYHILGTNGPYGQAIDFYGPLMYGSKYLNERNFIELEKDGTPATELYKMLVTPIKRFRCLKCNLWIDNGKERCSCPIKIPAEITLEYNVYVLNHESTRANDAYIGPNVFFSLLPFDENKYRQPTGEVKAPFLSMLSRGNELTWHMEVKIQGYKYDEYTKLHLWIVTPKNREVRAYDYEATPQEVHKMIDEAQKIVEIPSLIQERATAERKDRVIKAKNQALQRANDEIEEQTIRADEAELIADRGNPEQPVPRVKVSGMPTGRWWLYIGIGLLGFGLGYFIFPQGTIVSGQFLDARAVGAIFAFAGVVGFYLVRGRNPWKPL